KLIAMNDLTVVAKAAAKKKRCGRNHGQFLWARQKVASAPQFPRPHCTRLSCKANADAWAWPRIASLGAIDGALAGLAKSGLKNRATSCSTSSGAPPIGP